MNSMKRQKDITPEDESHRSKSETESLSVKSVSLQLMDCSPSTASVHEIFQQEYLSGLSFSSPGHFPDQFQGLDPRSPALQADSLPLSHQGSRSEGVQFATGKEQRTIPYSSRKKNEAAVPKQKQCSVVDVSGGESKAQYYKEQYCLITWNNRSMNQGKLNIVKQEIARLNTASQESLN